jgi:hypothetical protein
LAQQLYTLLGTAVGAVIGLLAPVVTSSTSRRAREQETQREIASSIMKIFEEGDSPTSVLMGQQNPARRRLYLLALRLKSRSARDACLRFIACSADSNDPADSNDSTVEHPDALTEWESMMGEVSKIYTGRS